MKTNSSMAERITLTAKRALVRLGRLVAAAAVVALAAVAAAPVAPAQALVRRSDEIITVPAGEVVADDLVATGREVHIDGTVRGDVFAFAQLVTVRGVIEGDLIAAAERLVIEDQGQVQGDVRLAGATVEVNGTVARNVTGAGQQFQLGPNGRVGGNVLGAGDTVTLGGAVGGNATAAGGDVRLQGQIGRNAELAFGSFSAAPDARIGGDLTYHSHTPIDLPAQLVAGRVQQVGDEAQAEFRERGREFGRQAEIRDRGREFGRQLRFQGRPWNTAFAVFWNVLSLAWLAGSAIVGLIALRLFPRFVAQFLDVLEARPLPSLGLGALAMVVTLPLAFLAALTVIGLPVAGLLAGAYFSSIFVGWLLLAVATGTILVGLARRGAHRHLSWSFLLGLLVLYVGTRIPFLGGLFAFTAASLGLGALLLALYRAWGRGQMAATPAPSLP